MHEFRYAAGRLHCEGVSIESLVEEFGTPLYVYSQRTLTNHFQKLDAALTPLDHLICYSVKANSNLAVLRALANLGRDRKSTRLNSSHVRISYAVFCLKKKNPRYCQMTRLTQLL